jgi:CRISPR/Cas system-associated protein endoribonuclease Cas2
MSPFVLPNLLEECTSNINQARIALVAQRRRANGQFRRLFLREDYEFLHFHIRRTIRVSDSHRPRTLNVSKSVHKSKGVITETRVAVRSTRWFDLVRLLHVSYICIYFLSPSTAKGH